jgi:hypothetical protein
MRFGWIRVVMFSSAIALTVTATSVWKSCCGRRPQGKQQSDLATVVGSHAILVCCYADDANFANTLMK